MISTETTTNYEPFETDNLFNEVYPNIASNVQKVEISVPNGAYTLSTTAPLNNNNGANLFLLKGNDSPLTSGNGVWNAQSRTIMITDGVLKIGYRSIQGVNPENYKTMLNTGSTALPYAPYGSTWNTKSYAKSISGAQTYTKFPIVLRTTEQSIPTYSIKGNMSRMNPFMLDIKRLVVKIYLLYTLKRNNIVALRHGKHILQTNTPMALP